MKKVIIVVAIVFATLFTGALFCAVSEADYYM